MTTITIPRAVVEQALEALESLFNWKVDPERGKRCGDAVVALRAALAQQAEPVEPVEPHRWEGDHNIESPFNACMHKHYCMTLKQAREPMVQQAEPVEPVDVGLLEYRGNSVAFIHQKMTAYRTGIDAAWDALRANGLHPDGKTSLADMIAKHTAPPQRKPLTEEEIRDLWSWSMTAEAERTATTQQHAFARAIERAHGIPMPEGDPK